MGEILNREIPSETTKKNFILEKINCRFSYFDTGFSHFGSGFSHFNSGFSYFEFGNSHFELLMV